MITEITAYKISNGEIFTNKVDAEETETYNTAKARLRNIVAEWFGDNDNEFIIEFLIVNKNKLIDLFNI